MNNNVEHISEKIWKKLGNETMEKQLNSAFSPAILLLPHSRTKYYWDVTPWVGLTHPGGNMLPPVF